VEMVGARDGTAGGDDALGCSSEEDDMHTQILRSATPKAGTADTSATG